LMKFCAFAMAACAGTATRTDLGAATQTGGDLMERQKCELQSCLVRFQGTEIEKREGCVAVAVCCDLLFESGSARISPATCCQLNDIAEVIKKYPETKIQVDAHTDCIRSEEDNMALSEMQAGAVKEVLVGQGVVSSRIAARGWGEAKPVSSNATEAGRQANRRLTITLVQQ
jgi:outer membrane protein OmpA-like peptidoglycan-associated protein